MSKRRPEQAEEMPGSATPATPGINLARSNAAQLAVFFVFAVGFVAYQRKFFAGWMPSFECVRIDLLVDRLLLLDYWFAGMFGDVPEAVGILDRMPIFFGVAAIIAAGYAAGRFALEACRLDRALDSLERPVFSIAVGMQLVSLFTLASGLAGLLTAWLFLPAIAGLLGAGLWRWWPRGAEEDEELPTKSLEQPAEDDTVAPWLWWLAIGTCVPAALVLLLGGVLPPYEFDVREYHLEVPKEWLQRGSIGFLPHNVYGNMPLGTEMHSLLAMVLSPGERPWYWGGLIGKSITALFPLLTALSLFALGRRLGSAWSGALAAAIYLGIPWITQVSLFGLIDAVLACHTILTLHAAILAIQSDESEESPPGTSPWILVGFLAGAAASCKYTGVPMVAVPAVGLALFGRGRLDWRPALLVVGIGLASGGLWYAKNVALTGNPVYPLLGKFFDGASRTPEMIEQWDRVHAPQPDALGNTHSLAQLAEGLEIVAWKSEFLSPIVIPLAAISLVYFWLEGRRRWVILCLWWCLWMFGVWWGLSHRLERFWLPAFPLLALLAGLGADWTSARWWRMFMAGLLLYGLAFEISCFAGAWFGETRFFVGLDYLRTDQPPPGMERWSRIASHTRRLVDDDAPRQSDEVTMIVAKADVFDVDGNYSYATCFDEPPIETLLGPIVRELHAAPPEGTSPAQDREQIAKRCQQLLDALRAAKVARIYMDWWEFYRYRSPGNYGFSPFVSEALFDELTDLEILVEHDAGDTFARRRRGFSMFLLNADFRATPEIIDRAITWRAAAAKRQQPGRIPGVLVPAE